MAAKAAASRRRDNSWRRSELSSPPGVATFASVRSTILSQQDERRCNCGDVSENAKPEDNSEAEFLRLVTEGLLTKIRAGPAAKQRHHMKRLLGHSISRLSSSPLIEPIRCERYDTQRRDLHGERNG